MSILRFDNVSYQYPGEDFDIIDGLSFSVEPGSFHCIVGVSGCGKSTIFRMINGLLPPKAGTISVNGKPITAREHYCGYMPQKDMLFPWRTIGENLALPLEIQRGYTKAQQRDMIDAALADVGLDGCRDKRPDELSGGMRQRAAFARTMLTGSDLLLLDEPFSALDFLTRISMHEWLLEQWQRHKKTILFITHDVEEAIFLSGSVSGTGFIMALCLFPLFSGLGIYFGFKGTALFAFGCAAGLLRTLFGPVSLPYGLMYPFEHMRAGLSSACASLFGEHAPLLNAMLWGVKGGISDSVYDAFRSCGIAHILALSGLHVSFVVGALNRLTRRALPRVKFYTSIVVLFAYCAIAAFPSSLIRASVMSLCSLYAAAAGRRYEMP